MPSCSCTSSSSSTPSTWRWSVFEHSTIEARAGFVLLRVSGARAREPFRHEPGGHRWQRIPPTEKRGRVHTSTITVAVLDAPRRELLHIDPGDLDESFTRGSGKGGQHRNKTDTCVMLVHRPTGMRVRVDGGRSQATNPETALAQLRRKLEAQARERGKRSRNAARSGQVGSGMRGDKVRTVALQRDSVTDHRTGRSMRAKQYLRGQLRALLGS